MYLPDPVLIRILPSVKSCPHPEPLFCHIFHHPEPSICHIRNSSRSFIAIIRKPTIAQDITRKLPICHSEPLIHARIGRPIIGIYQIAHSNMNVWIGTVAAHAVPFLGLFVSNFLYWVSAVRIKAWYRSGATMAKTRQSNMHIKYRQQHERRAAYRKQRELQVYMPLNVPRVAGAPVTFRTDRQLLRRSQGTNQSSQREPPSLTWR
jgi:hypothetical protein